MKNIVYVHGASSTPVTFNYIEQNLPEHRGRSLQYNSNGEIEDHVDILSSLLNTYEDVTVISHSLGGIISVAASYNVVKTRLRLVTISSPFAGSKAATYLKWLYPGYGLFNNVAMSNPIIKTILTEGAVVPTLNIITTGGDSPLMKEANDGVITVSSQLSLDGCRQIIHKLNHFEVLLSPEVVKDIKEFIWNET